MRKTTATKALPLWVVTVRSRTIDVAAETRDEAETIGRRHLGLTAATAETVRVSKRDQVVVVPARYPTARKDPNGVQLYGHTEAAKYLGVTQKNLSALRMRGKMIAPVAQLTCGPVWSRSQLDEQLWHWRDIPRGRKPNATEG